MSLEGYLLQYGVLGLWTATLLMDKYKFYKSVKKALDNNTMALRKLTIKLLDK
jgi:hypothetical protein